MLRESIVRLPPPLSISFAGTLPYMCTLAERGTVEVKCLARRFCLKRCRALQKLLCYVTPKNMPEVYLIKTSANFPTIRST